MAGQNNFYPYGESSTNILNNSEYQTDQERTAGAAQGAIARSKMYNKALRQAAAGAYAVAAMVSAAGKTADDSSAATLAGNFQAAVSYQARSFVAQSVSISGTTAVATVPELASTAQADLPALFTLALSLDQALPAGSSVQIASSLPSTTLVYPIYSGGEPLEDDVITAGAVSLLIDTVGGKAFFKAGGGKIPADLPPLLPNFALEFSGTTVTVTANKLPLNDKTSMLAGGVWVLASTIPDSPKGAIVQQWSQSDLIDSTQDTESDEVVTWTYPNWSAGEPIYCRQYTYNEKGQYNTSLYGGLVSTEDAPPFALPVFTGNHAIFGDETQGRIELYESGDLTLSPGTYDFFLVGGGGSGNHGGGAGSGYTHTEKAKKVDKTQVFSVLVGASDSKSEISNKTAGNILATAEKGSPGTSSSGTGNGGNGGSGGGSYGDGGNGGSNGSNGGKGSVKGNPGQGQGTTTRSFGEENGVLFAGGGGAAAAGNSNPPVGGEGGGGRGGTYDGKTPNTPGTPNTGGGGGSRAGTSYIAPGGSGIIIARWNNAV